MINYICKVELEDNFRFQLIHIQKRPSKMNRIAVYEIHHTEWFRIRWRLSTHLAAIPADVILDADQEFTEIIQIFSVLHTVSSSWNWICCAADFQFFAVHFWQIRQRKRQLAHHVRWQSCAAHIGIHWIRNAFSDGQSNRPTSSP